MKIALCHLETSMGPEEKNIAKIEKALTIAVENGADWVVTPETSLQGYYFYRNDNSKKDRVDIQPSVKLSNILSLVKQNKVYLFLGAGEYDPVLKKNYNSCLVFGPNGELVSKHRKIFNHGMGSEAWASPSDCVNTIKCDDIEIGVLVCADAWFYDNLDALKQKGAELIIVIAAWPPSKECGNPLAKWKENAGKVKLPFILCNQTGKNPYMDMTIGESVVIEDGELSLTYQGEEVVLLFDINLSNRKVKSEKFQIIKL